MSYAGAVKADAGNDLEIFDVTPVPGWNSIDGTGWWSSFYFWAGILSLLLPGATEVLSHRYGKRHDELVSVSENARAHDVEVHHAAEVAAIQKKVAERAPRDISLDQHDALAF
jgi:hypothetical protein